MVPILVLLTFLVIIIVTGIIGYAKEARDRSTAVQSLSQEFLSRLPLGYLVSKNHVWLNRGLQDSFKVGIDELVQRFIGVPDEIYFKKQGEIIHRGENLAVFKKEGKELYLKAPVGCEILKVNDSLASQPRLFKKDPYKEGWLYTVKVAHEHIDLNDIRTDQDARQWLKNEFMRLRDFLHAQFNRPALAGITLTDGGLPIEGMIEFLEQEKVILFERLFLQVNGFDKEVNENDKSDSISSH